MSTHSYHTSMVSIEVLICSYNTDLEPCKHKFPWRELGLAYLVSDNERPY